RPVAARRRACGDRGAFPPGLPVRSGAPLRRARRDGCRRQQLPGDGGRPPLRRRARAPRRRVRHLLRRAALGPHGADGHGRHVQQALRPGDDGLLGLPVHENERGSAGTATGAGEEPAPARARPGRGPAKLLRAEPARPARGGL
ncbi:unnamed protein product, partial [Prorocentrum cordatum]